MSSRSAHRPRDVRPLSLSKIADVVRAQLLGSSSEISVTGVVQSGAAAGPGDLYVGLPGERTHGARFTAQAAEAGAVALLTDVPGAAMAREVGLPTLVVDDPRAVVGSVAAEVYDYPSSKLTVVGITGTNGKTTTAHLLDAIFRGTGKTTALLGTIGTRIADVEIPSARTTPEAAELHALLAAAVEAGVTHVTMEVSSHALTLGRVNGVSFAAGAFTNLSQDHLDFHASMAEYFDAKAMLFDGRCRREIVMVDDEAGAKLIAPGRVTVSAAGRDAAWRATDIQVDRFAQRFTVHTPDGATLPALVHLPGDFNVANALLATSIAATLGIPAEAAVRALGEAPGVPGRMERVGATDVPVLAVVDYAHAPDGVSHALATLRPATAGRLICVLGCGGDRDAAKRPLMGAAAVAGADLFVATDDNPRSEAPEAIRAAMLDGARGATGATGATGAEIVEVGDRAEAIRHAVRASHPGDTIAVLGKGHELGQEIAGVTHPFDDREVLGAALNEVYG